MGRELLTHYKRQTDPRIVKYNPSCTEGKKKRNDLSLCQVPTYRTHNYQTISNFI